MPTTNWQFCSRSTNHSHFCKLLASDSTYRQHYCLPSFVAWDGGVCTVRLDATKMHCAYKMIHENKGKINC
ncbi:hypothetical protein PC120_g15523 [Phytophthora cactorum]|nr:hypothetical protein PC120_g15523 [Phytophthora cactorum]